MMDFNWAWIHEKWPMNFGLDSKRLQITLSNKKASIRTWSFELWVYNSIRCFSNKNIVRHIVIITFRLYLCITFEATQKHAWISFFCSILKQATFSSWWRNEIKILIKNALSFCSCWQINSALVFRFDVAMFKWQFEKIVCAYVQSVWSEPLKYWMSVHCWMNMTWTAMRCERLWPRIGSMYACSTHSSTLISSSHAIFFLFAFKIPLASWKYHQPANKRLENAPVNFIWMWKKCCPKNVAHLQ